MPSIQWAEHLEETEFSRQEGRSSVRTEEHCQRRENWSASKGTAIKLLERKWITQQKTGSRFKPHNSYLVILQIYLITLNMVYVIVEYDFPTWMVWPWLALTISFWETGSTFRWKRCLSLSSVTLRTSSSVKRRPWRAWHCSSSLTNTNPSANQNHWQSLKEIQLNLTKYTSTCPNFAKLSKS